MSSHTKGSIMALTGAALLLLTVIIRHTSANAATAPWTDTYLPIAGFILIAVGMYYRVKAPREPMA
ncbi:MAG: hypothetical protein M3Z17_08200 [Gemmatimonadota bacterium]|nr:hypothetical protein [Gemmatimonadota bacterium]